MEAGTDDSQRQDHQPDLLFLGLRCAVCLDFYEKPHTLNCGHTFCLRCLRTLAKMSRGSSARPPLDRLRFRCPSCRKMTVARPLLRRHASVNIALRDVVDAWMNSPYSVGKLETISLRSIASQTENTIDKSDLHGEVQSDDDDIDSIISIDTEGIHSDHQLVMQCAETAGTLDIKNDNEDNGEDVVDDEEEEEGEEGSGRSTPTETPVDDGISREETRKVTVHRFQAKTAMTKNVLNSEGVSSSMRKRRNMPEEEESPTDPNEVMVPSDVTFETSSSDDDIDVEVVPFLGDIHVIQDPPRRSVFAIRSFVTLIKLLSTEIHTVLVGIWSSNCRLGLTVFWFAYGALIVCLSRSFFPWMVLYTLVYFLIMYAEMARPFMMGY